MFAYNEKLHEYCNSLFICLIVNFLNSPTGKVIMKKYLFLLMVLTSCSKEEPEIFKSETFFANEFYIENNQEIRSVATITFESEKMLTITRKGTSKTVEYRINDKPNQADTLFVGDEIFMKGDSSIISFDHKYFFSLKDFTHNYYYYLHNDDEIKALRFCEFMTVSISIARKLNDMICVQTMNNIEDNIDYDALFEKYTEMFGFNKSTESEYTLSKNEFGTIDILCKGEKVGNATLNNGILLATVKPGIRNFSILRKNLIEFKSN